MSLFKGWTFLLCICGLLSPLYPLSIDRVILSTDKSPMYAEFWAVVAPLWKQMGIEPTLAYISEDDEGIDLTLGEVIRFDPIPNVSIALQAQVIRLFLPILFPDDGCLISDIDMLPISRDYFVSNALFCPDDTFLLYRKYPFPFPYPEPDPRYPMCYNAAKGRVFAELFGITDKGQIPSLIQSWASLGLGWPTDEIMLVRYIRDWEARGGRTMHLNHPIIKRLDRAYWEESCRNKAPLTYIDCHCPKPYSEYKESIDRFVDIIEASLKESVFSK